MCHTNHRNAYSRGGIERCHHRCSTQYTHHIVSNRFNDCNLTILLDLVSYGYLLNAERFDCTRTEIECRFLDSAGYLMVNNAPANTAHQQKRLSHLCLSSGGRPSRIATLYEILRQLSLFISGRNSGHCAESFAEMECYISNDESAIRKVMENPRGDAA